MESMRSMDSMNSKDSMDSTDSMDSIEPLKKVGVSVGSVFVSGGSFDCIT